MLVKCSSCGNEIERERTHGTVRCFLCRKSEIHNRYIIKKQKKKFPPPDGYDEWEKIGKEKKYIKFFLYERAKIKKTSVRI